MLLPPRTIYFSPSLSLFPFITRSRGRGRDCKKGVINGLIKSDVVDYFFPGSTGRSARARGKGVNEILHGNACFPFEFCPVN